jgi:hypothetical protein
MDKDSLPKVGDEFAGPVLLIFDVVIMEVSSLFVKRKK